MKKLSNIAVLFMILFAKLVPFNWIVGSLQSTFSLTTIFAPVIATHFGFGWISLFFLSKSLVIPNLIWNPVIYQQALLIFFFSLLHRTPLLFAARAYQKCHWTTSLAVPVLCMLLFVTHEVGSVAWCYSLYWLIPMILFFVKNSVVTRALSACFVAHAVGSVIWLYTTNIAAEIWIGLIPIVFCERLLMAGGMLALDFAITRVRAAQVEKVLFKKLGFA